MGSIMIVDLKERTKIFALRIIKLVESLPSGRTSDVIGRQLVKCGTSVGANYRAACRAKSQADFIAKMGIVEEEADESIFWMEVLIESGLMRKELLHDLMDEADQLVSIFVSSINTARGRKRNNLEK
jgi:four helix bundle protein